MKLISSRTKYTLKLFNEMNNLKFCEQRIKVLDNGNMSRGPMIRLFSVYITETIVACEHIQHNEHFHVKQRVPLIKSTIVLTTAGYINTNEPTKIAALSVKYERKNQRMRATKENWMRARYSTYVCCRLFVRVPLPLACWCVCVCMSCSNRATTFLNSARNTCFCVVIKNPKQKHFGFRIQTITR